MAPVTTAIDAISFFYPIGNTPAVDFTQELAPECPAQMLLLGCGDVRSILYTAYTNSKGNRPLSFTCCDFEGAIIARNILLLSAILDKPSEKTLDSLWKIYYHFWLSTDDRGILQRQAVKLLNISASLEVWDQGPYAKSLKFYDMRSLSEVRRVWKSYCTAYDSQGSSMSHATILKQRIEQAKGCNRRLMGENGVNLSGMRSAAPLAYRAGDDLLKTSKYFWQHGTLPVETDTAKTSHDANPMFASFLTATSMLHYGLDPLLGYHLAAAYVKITGTSPYASIPSAVTDLEKLSRTARSQFKIWAQAYQQTSSLITVEVMVGDALVFCSALSDRNTDNHPRESELLPSKPSRVFNVIDTSNLADHLGSLNLLICVIPLLDPVDQSTVYTDILVKHNSELASTFTSILHGDFVTMAALLGLWPIEYWTNASFVAPEEAIFNSISKSMPGFVKDIEGQEYCRMLWKPSVLTGRSLQIDTADLVQGLHGIYKSLFDHEELGSSISRLLASPKGRQFQLPKSHRGSFVALLAYLKSRVQADWHSVSRSLVDAIERDCGLMGQNFIQELYVQLHLFNIFSADALLRPKSASSLFSTDQGSLRGQSDVPPALCVTLQVPLASLKPFTDVLSKPEKLGSPLVVGIIKSSPTFKGRAWMNCFAAVELCFGKVRKGSKLTSLEPHLAIETDEANWSSKESPLLASFMVPSWLLLMEPEDAVISLALQSSPQSVLLFADRLGLELTIYSTRQGNRAEVYLSTSPPQLATPLSPGRVQNSLSLARTVVVPTASDRSPVHLAFASHGFRMSSATTKWELPPGSALDALRGGGAVSLTQDGPFSIRITVSKSPASFDEVLRYPLPVRVSAASIRIARKSAYIEVTVRTHVFAAGSEQDALLTSFPRHATTIANVPRLNNDLHPGLDLKQNLDWLTPHISFQMSDSERKLRERYMRTSQDCPSTRVNLKDSLMSLYMHYSGVQGQKAEVFGLSVPDHGGVHILVLVSALKLDLGNHTVFLDAAVIPLTHSKMQSLNRFLGAITERRLCQIQCNLEELKLWHGMLATYVERCRTWQHKQTCEWQSEKWKQQPWVHNQDPLCSCGRGLGFPEKYLSLPQWKTAERYAVRAAISPLYFVPYVDKVYDASNAAATDFCAVCSRDGSDAKLLACGRCKVVKYCSKECQKADWNAHKKFCKT